MKSQSATTMFEVGSAVLGYVGLTASWRRATEKHNESRGYGPMLIVQSYATTDEGAHAPAQSVEIRSREGLLALRDAIDEALKEPQR